METFKFSRGYNELIERLDIERVSDNKYLPREIVSAANDDNDIDYLPCDETGTAVDDNNDEIVIDITMTCLLYTSRCV